MRCSRAARLSEPARALLDAVAVVPRRLEVWLLEALEKPVPACIEECLGSGMHRRIALHRRVLSELSDPRHAASIRRG